MFPLGLLEFQATKTALLPRIKKLCINTSLLSVRVNCLVCIGKLLQHLDKWLVLDDVLPMLQQIPSREPAVIMAIIGKNDQNNGRPWIFSNFRLNFRHLQVDFGRLQVGNDEGGHCHQGVAILVSSQHWERPVDGSIHGHHEFGSRIDQQCGGGTPGKVGAAEFHSNGAKVSLVWFASSSIKEVFIRFRSTDLPCKSVCPKAWPSRTSSCPRLDLRVIWTKCFLVWDWNLTSPRETPGPWPPV